MQSSAGGSYPGKAEVKRVSEALAGPVLDQLFRNARTHRAWQARVIEPELLSDLYNLMKWAPTTNNTSPARIIFVVSRDAKERLKPHLNPGNVEQTISAPATAVIAYDLEFYRFMPKLSPKPGARESWHSRSPAELQEAAFRNGSLQAGYFIIAARTLGLDCGPMSGFNNAGVDGEFFSGTSIKSNLLCNLGYGLPESLRPRAGRLEFDEACSVL
jgi:3-hydroxypropanoate dehydrogenase